jgi:hypothetical protein
MSTIKWLELKIIHCCFECVAVMRCWASSVLEEALRRGMGQAGFLKMVASEYVLAGERHKIWRKDVRVLPVPLHVVEALFGSR